MDGLSQLSLLLILLMEIAVLTFLEYKAWKTIYTPLCCLMLPYAVVLLITIAIAGNFGFARFNYESLYVWIYGLPFFALPSQVFATFLRYSGKPVKGPIIDKSESLPPVFIAIAAVLVALLMYKLFQTLSSGLFLFGTDDFAEEFSGAGLWAHLREMLTPLLIISLYYVRKNQYWLWALIALMLFIQFSFMVKGTIIIATASALLMRMYAGRMHLSLTLIIGVIAGSFGVFLLIYMVLPLLGNDGEADMFLLEFIAKHFIHYLTSGTMGWSYDIDQNIPDRNEFVHIIAPFHNIYSMLSGGELVSSVNPFYWNTGITNTNVRTFFGTLYIYSDTLQFITTTLVISTVIYLIKAIALSTRNIYVYTIHFYYCGLLAMGWFEFYFFHLAIIEGPIVILLLALIAKDNRTSNESAADRKEVAV